MSTQVRDPFLAVTIDGSGATHYRVSHTAIADASYVRLPTPETDGTYIVPYNLPNIPSTYTVNCQLKNSIHESTVVGDSVILLSDVVEGVSTLRNKLRLSQVYGPNADVNTYCDSIKCFYSWVSLYNNSAEAINLSTVKLWMSWGNATSVEDTVNVGQYVTTPNGTVTEWTSVSLSGTIQPHSYFLIQGQKANNIISEVTLEPNVAISFSTFIPDLVLPELFCSSKCCSLFLSDSTVTSVTGNPFSDGALTVGFIDQYGITNVETAETYPAPYSYLHYISKNSKQQVKTLINPTVEHSDNSTDYVSLSIKNLTPTTIIGTSAQPRNSSYVGS